MKLCHRCIDDIEEATGRPFPYDMEEEKVPESECEFWAHKELNLALYLQEIRKTDPDYRPAYFAGEFPA